MQDNPAAPKKRMGPIEWIRTYGYYYKGVFAVAVIVLIVILAFIFLLRYDGADLRLYIVTQDAVEDEAYYNFLQNVEEYVYDVDSDNTKISRQYRYTLSESETSLPLSELPEKAATNDCLCFIVDDAGYEYVSSLCSLRELSFFEIQSDADNPYRLTLNDTALLEGLTLREGVTYYLVMKYIDNTEYNDVFLSGRTDIIVGMARNNDKSEDNNVTIQS
ncbi:MAG: hypothetical protein SOX31_02725 [Eubacteriales bacterium]|nr:hypothetical protein [Eubacteriales bacterium]MDY3285474.1 hypothetical protein [Eubacteriales bacterium]